MVHQKDAEVRQILHIEEFPPGRSVPPAGHGRRPRHFRLMKATDQSGQDMAAGGVIIIIGPVKISGHHRDVVCTVLAVQVGAVFQPGNLSQRVSLVRFLQGRRQEAVLLHGLRGEARVNAGGAQKFQLPAAVFPGSVDHIHFQNHIVVHEIRREFAVGSNAPHLRRRQKNVGRPLSGEKFLHRRLPAEV